MKNRVLTALAFAGLMGIAACGGNDEARVDDTTTEIPATTPAVEPAPTTTTDPMMAPQDTLMQDTLRDTLTVPPTTP